MNDGQWPVVFISHSVLRNAIFQTNQADRSSGVLEIAFACKTMFCSESLQLWLLSGLPGEVTGGIRIALETSGESRNQHSASLPLCEAIN
jgi:hypothetical protein